MLLPPVVLLTSTLSPVAVLLPPVVLLRSAWTPLAVLLLPVVLLRSALSPVAVLLPPVELKTSALTPVAVLLLPVVLLKGIESDGGVVGTCGVAEQRPCPQAGVALRRRNPRQRERANERSYKDGEKRSRVGRMTRHIIPSLFVGLELRRVYRTSIYKLYEGCQWRLSNIGHFEKKAETTCPAHFQAPQQLIVFAVSNGLASSAFCRLQAVGEFGAGNGLTREYATNALRASPSDQIISSLPCPLEPTRQF